MIKNVKITLVSILALLMSIFGIMGLAQYNAKADDIEEKFVMQGAQVRLNEDSTGIRFIAETNNVDENATYNFVIAPTYYFEAVAGATDWVKAFEDHEQIGYFINLKNITPENCDEDDALEIRGSVSNIKFENMNLDFTGIAYKEYADGSRVYAQLEEGGNVSRSVPYVSSVYLNMGIYDGEDYAREQEVMSNFIKKAFVKASGYAEKVEEEVVTYVKDDAELSLEEAYQVIAPSITINANSTQKLLHSQEVSATIEGVNLEIILSVNDANLLLKDGSVQTLNENGGTIAAKAGILTAEKDIDVDTVEKLTATSDTIVYTDKENALTFGAGISVTPVNVYDVTAAATELGYESGKLATAPALGERKLAVLTADNTYYVDAVASDCVIKTKQDLAYYLDKGATKGWTSTNGVLDRSQAMYAILANDIQCDVDTDNMSRYIIGKGLTNPKKSVFDGRGYTISDLFCYDGWYGQGTQTNTTIKNVRFENFKFVRTATFGQNLDACKIENVYLNVVLVGSAYSLTDWGGLSILFNHSSENYPTTVSNCKIRVMTVQSRITEKLWVAELGGYNLVNTEIVTNAKFALNGEKNTHGNACTATILEEGSSNYTIIQGLNDATVSDVTLDSTGKIMAANALGNGTVEELFVYNTSAQRYLPYNKDGDNLIFNKDITTYYGYSGTTNNKNHWCAFKTENGWYWGEITFKKTA